MEERNFGGYLINKETTRAALSFYIHQCLSKGYQHCLENWKMIMEKISFDLVLTFVKTMPGLRKISLWPFVEEQEWKESFFVLFGILGSTKVWIKCKRESAKSIQNQRYQTRKGKGIEHSPKGSSRAFCCSPINFLVNCTTTNCGTIIAKSQTICFLRKSHEYETCVEHHGCNHSHYSESQATYVCLHLKTPWHLYKLFFIRCTGWKFQIIDQLAPFKE